MNPRRPRLALVVSDPAPAYPPALTAELARFSSSQRSMLALVMVDKLSTTEAALALGIPVEQLERAYRDLIERLRATLGGRTAPVPVPVPVRRPAVRLRKVS